MKFFVTLISLAKRNLFSPWMLHIFTVIPNDEGLRALKHFSDQRTVKEPSSEALLRLAELVLAFNCFSFCGNYHNQTNGVAMGTKILIQVGQSFRRFYRNQYLVNTTAPNLNSTAATLTIASALPPLPENSSLNL